MTGKNYSALDTSDDPTPRVKTTLSIPADLLTEADEFRQEHRWDNPEVYTYRSNFVTAAIEYYLASLKKDKENERLYQSSHYAPNTVTGRRK